MKKKKNKETENLEESELKQQVDILESQITELKNENLVRLAELDNSKKRLEREFIKYKEFANEKIILDLLEVLDNLERALAAEGDIRAGVKMIQSQFLEVLKREGLKDIPVQEFNPEFHQAVDISSGEENAVIEVRKGYSLSNKVIRPALVKLINKED